MRVPHVPFKTSFTKFYGGLDVVTPPLTAKPGTCQSCYNIYMGVNGGYFTIKGYEPWDGNVDPSKALHALLRVTITGALSVGDTVTSGAKTAVVCAIKESKVAVTKVVGTFAAGDVLNNGAVVGTVTEAAELGGDTVQEKAIFRASAADMYRADVQALPGAGPVRAVFYLKGKWYGIRDDVTETTAAIYELTGTGPVATPFMRKLSFTSGGTYEPQEGDVVTDGTATATIRRIAVRTGSFAGTDGAGIFVVDAQTGVFAAGDVSINGNANAATISGDSTPVGLTAHGNYDIVTANFTGIMDGERIYFANGKDTAMEFDGAILAPIETGTPVDNPTSICAHRDQLFLSFDAVCQHSAPGTPYKFSLVFGADSLATGDRITGFLSMPGVQGGSTLAVYCRNSIHMIYGNNVTDFKVVPFKAEAGGIDKSMQLIGRAYCFDDRGVVSLKTTTAYGNFADATESQAIQPILRGLNKKLLCSMVSREENLYWLFFSDASALCATVDNGKIVAFSPVLFGKVFTSVCSAEVADGTEEIVFGGDDGFIYKYGNGTSFAGRPIEWLAELSYENDGTPEVYKRYRYGMLELTGFSYAEFSFSYNLEYRNQAVRQQPVSLLEMADLSPDRWDATGATWDVGQWDGMSLVPHYFREHGSGTNFALKLHGSNNYSGQLMFSGFINKYSFGREKR